MKHDGLVVAAVILLALNAGCAVVNPTRFPTPEALQALREDSQLTSSQERVARAHELYGMDVGLFTERIGESYGLMDMKVTAAYLRSAGLEAEAEKVRDNFYFVLYRLAVVGAGLYLVREEGHASPAVAGWVVGAPVLISTVPYFWRKRAAGVLNEHLREQVE